MSGREDLNLRPYRPERYALTGLRYAPSKGIFEVPKFKEFRFICQMLSD